MLTRILVALTMISPASAAQVAIDSDFGFGSGTPFSGTTTIDGVNVDLTSQNTQPFSSPAGPPAFRDVGMLVNKNDAFVTFAFDKQISEFALRLERVSDDEFVTDFSIGDPTSVMGQLIRTASGISGGLVNSDFGFGTLHWTGIRADTISFTINAPDGAVAVTGFGLTPIPLPAAGWLLIAAFGGLLGAKRLRARA